MPKGRKIAKIISEVIGSKIGIYFHRWTTSNLMSAQSTIILDSVKIKLPCANASIVIAGLP
jgi:hypothetical protein